VGEEDLRRELRLEGPMMLYVGNLERYQGIDLMLDSFHLARQRGCHGTIVLIGGTPSGIDFYRRRTEELGLSDAVHFCGPRPVELLGHYLRQADILLSPRITGNNTPMKLYSYLDSGRAVLATDLPTHTQVLSRDFACLVAPNPESMARAMAELLEDPSRCAELGARGRQVARDNYSLAAYRIKLQGFYDTIVAALPPSIQPLASS
jgi:glycosyltransferase involved in cell wall biosynthesis